VDAAKAAPAEMKDAGDPAAVWADNEAPITGGPGVAGDSLHGLGSRGVSRWGLDRAAAQAPPTSWLG
jgi:hypothetical protein